MTILPNIFKIDKEHRLLKGLQEARKIINTIISDSYARSGWELKKSDLDDISSFVKDEVTYYLFLYSAADKQSEWASFLPDELKNSSEKFSQTKLSLVLFIQTEFDLYAIVGGSAYRIIVNFIDHLFGLTTYDKIILPESDEATSTKSRGITGRRIGMSEQFRDEYKMINYLQFGKIPKELHVKLAKETTNEHFYFLAQKTTDRLNITVGKAFRVNKQVDFDTLHKIIIELGYIKAINTKDFLSSYIQIRNTEFIEKLQKELNRRIFNNIPVILGTSRDSRDRFEFDFCSPNNIEAFYEAETYELKEKKEDKHELFATLTNKDKIYATVVTRAYEVCGNDEIGILYYLRGVRVLCYQGKKQTTSAGFLFHFNAEFLVNDEPVFLIDTKWYKVKDTFVQNLMTQTEMLFRNSKLPSGILGLTWDKKGPNNDNLIDEGDYNMLYDGRPNYFVMDKITSDGVEICDIIYFTTTELYIIHVKHTFAARVRELTNQILISARRVSEAIATKNKLLFSKVYEQIESRSRSVNNLTKDEFTQLFFERKILYVFATASQFESDLIIEDNIGSYASNIARFSLTTCSSEMRTVYFDLLTAQIRRTTPSSER